jgi:hypothetical protein
MLAEQSPQRRNIARMDSVHYGNSHRIACAESGHNGASRYT